MKTLMLVLTMVFSVSAFAQTEDLPKKAYKFDLRPLKGDVQEFKVSFVNPEDGMAANVEAKLKSGELIKGQFSCSYKNDKAMIQCERDEDGGEFSFVRSGEDYTLNFERFDLHDEGEDREIAVKSRHPAGEGDSVPGIKVEE